MKISVIIPVYNVEKYIRRCLLSVKDQKCEDFNIECLIVDDCSPDGSMTIVRDLIEKNDDKSITFTIISHEKNKGLSEARNSGIKASTGDYLYFIDSDDDILENTFARYYSYLHEYPFVDVIMGNSLEREYNLLTNTTVTYLSLISDKQTIIYNLLCRKIDRHAWNKLIRRSFIVDNNLFFDTGLLYEDVTWTYRLFTTVSSVLIVPELTYMYEYNPSSIVHTHAKRSSKILWSFVFISDYIFNNPPKINGKKVFYTEHSLFVNHWLLYAIDNFMRYEAEKSIRIKLNSLKRKMFWSAVCHLRPALASYFLIMFKPLCWLLKVRVFRANIDRIIRVVYKLS